MNVTEYPSFQRLPEAEQTRLLAISEKRSRAAKERWRRERAARLPSSYRDASGRLWRVLRLPYPA